MFLFVFVIIVRRTLRWAQSRGGLCRPRAEAPLRRVWPNNENANVCPTVQMTDLISETINPAKIFSYLTEQLKINIKFTLNLYWNKSQGSQQQQSSSRPAGGWWLHHVKLPTTHQLLELETKVKRRFAKFSQSQRRPLLGPSPGWKHLLALSHLRHY